MCRTVSKLVFFATLQLLLSQCLDPLRHCLQNRDCTSESTCVQGLCVLKKTVDAGTPRLVFLSPDADSAINQGMIPVTVVSLPLSVQPAPVKYELALTDGGARQSGYFTTQRGNEFSEVLAVRQQGSYSITATSGTLKASVSFNVDWVPPQVSLVAYPPRERVNDAGFSEVDPDPNYNDAYRRDEIVLMKILSSEELPDSGVHWSVRDQSVKRTNCRDSCDAGFCACFEFDLSAIDTGSGFHGNVGLRAYANDSAGNSAETNSVPIKVTRWKWRKTILSPDVYPTPPTLDAKGRIFVGSYNGMDGGTLVALNSTGTDVFRVDAYHGFEMHLIVSDKLYAATSDDSSGAIRQIDPDTGIRVRSACEAKRHFQEQMFLVDEGTPQQRIVALGYDSLVMARPGAASGPTCIERPGMEANQFVMSNGAALITGNDFYVQVPILADGWGVASNHPLPFLPARVFPLPTSSTPGFRLVGMGNTAGHRGVFVQNNDGGYTTVFHSSFSNSLDELLIGGTLTQPFLVAVVGTSILRADIAPDDPGQLKISHQRGIPSETYRRSQPILAADRVFYVADLQGRISAYSTEDFRLIDTNFLIANASFGIYLSIDVGRQPDGTKDCTQPGVLYALERAGGNLYAFIVDSKGIDAEAPWPKYQHDPRNTGNAKTSLKDFSCP